jgi:invasion protein IalB
VITPGLVVRPDPKADGWKVDYTVCNAAECEAVAQVGADQMKALQASKQTAISIALDNGKTVSVSLDMDGFVAGVTALAAQSLPRK